MLVALAILGITAMACAPAQSASDRLESADPTPSLTETTSPPTSQSVTIQPTETPSPTEIISPPTPKPATIQPTETPSPTETISPPTPQPANTHSTETQDSGRITADEFPFNLKTLRAYGDPSSSITIVEFSDFQCPFCRKFHEETLPLIKKNYIDPGIVSLAFIDLPLESFHPEARSAARAAWCADEQGAFWEYHDLLFDNQDKFARDTFAGNTASWANDLALDSESFGMCYESERFNDKVTEGVDISASLGIRSVPFFLFFKDDEFIGPVSGAQPYAVFERAIAISLAATSEE